MARIRKTFDKKGVMIESSHIAHYTKFIVDHQMNPHTQIGIKKGRKGEYNQTLEWGNGKLIQRTDWTVHRG